MGHHLIALDKCLGVERIVVGEVWQWLFAKGMIAVGGSDTKEICGSNLNIHYHFHLRTLYIIYH